MKRRGARLKAQGEGNSICKVPGDRNQVSGKDKNVSCPLSLVHGNDQAKAKGKLRAEGFDVQDGGSVEHINAFD
jgi:hypothetical protein